MVLFGPFAISKACCHLQKPIGLFRIACGLGFAASALWLRLFDFGFTIWVRGFGFAASAISSTFWSCAFRMCFCRSFCLSWLFGNFSLRLRYSATELQCEFIRGRLLRTVNAHLEQIFVSVAIMRTGRPASANSYSAGPLNIKSVPISGTKI